MTMDFLDLAGTIALLFICIVLPSALAMYFSAPPDSDVRYR